MNLKDGFDSVAYKVVVEKIKNRSARIGVVGVGYVGQALARGIISAGFQTLGYDIDSAKLRSISDPLFSPANSIEELGSCEVICICVPTPLDDQKKPDLSHLLSVVSDLAKIKGKNQLIIVESTVAPGTLRRNVLPIFLKNHREISRELLLAISPERIDPGNIHYTIENTPKVVGGINEDSTRAAVEFYSTFVSQVVPTSSPEAAELTKMLENTFRLVNISLINQVKDYADRAKIDIWEVIEAASTKPYAFMPHYPGPGAGGHCIPVDPAYLLEEAEKLGVELSLVRQALETNEEQAKKIVSQAKKKLNGRLDAVDKKMLLVGVAYKPNTSDTRESPALRIWQEAIREGFEVEFSDPHVERFNGKKSLEISRELLNEQDVIVIVTNHSQIPYQLFLETQKPILDTRNALRRFNINHPEKVETER